MRTAGLFLVSALIAVLLGELIVRAVVPVRNVGPTFSEYDPVYGKRLKKSYSCTRTAAEFSMKFSTNSLGFRGAEPRTFPSGGVLFIGDSFTSGYGVNDGEEFPALIARELGAADGANTVPVVNAGTGNTGNGYWLRFLEREYDVYKPRAIVFGFCVNDFLDNAVEQLYDVDQQGRLRDTGVMPRQEAARGAQAVIEAVPGLAYSHLVGLARQMFSESGSAPASYGAGTADTLTYRLLDTVLAFSARHGVPAVLLQIGVDSIRAGHIDALVVRHGAVGLRAPSKAGHPELYYKTDGHWNAAGHRAIASALLPIVRAALHQHTGEDPQQ
jgi:lysophospholipase L1-like esterase